MRFRIFFSVFSITDFVNKIYKYTKAMKQNGFYRRKTFTRRPFLAVPIKVSTSFYIVKNDFPVIHLRIRDGNVFLDRSV